MCHQIDTVHWFTDLPHPRSVAANGGIYVWKDGRKNADTLTAVFDYGPLDDPATGFQVVYSSRMHNSAGGVKEYYFSNGGKLDLDKNIVTPEGGLTQNAAAEMGMKANLLEEFKLPTEIGGDGGRHGRRSDDGQAHAELDGMRPQPQDASRRCHGRLPPLHRLHHDHGRVPDGAEGHVR